MIVKNIFYQLNSFGLVNFVWDNPLSVIIGKLGTGKTLLLTYLSQTMKLLTDEIYSNYPLKDDKVKVLTFKNLDFTDRTKPVPLDDSVILFDEIIYILTELVLTMKKKFIVVKYRELF
nr:hypothetical protein [Spiroplasma citri]